jgi:transcriptional regulator with XRE-family HTH domain
MSQRQLAEVMGVHKQTISDWETLRRNPRIRHLRKLSQIFDVSIDFIVCNPHAGNFITTPPIHAAVKNKE